MKILQVGSDELSQKYELDESDGITPGSRCTTPKSGPWSDENSCVSYAICDDGHVMVVDKKSPHCEGIFFD